MTTPLPTTAQRVLVNSDVAVQVAQYAAGWTLDLTSLSVSAYSVEAQCSSVDHAQRLAAGFDLTDVQVYKHRHNDTDQVHTRWRGDWHGTDLHVVTVQRAEAIGRVA